MRSWPGRSSRGRRHCLRGHEALDELIELPRGWLKSPGGVWRLRRRLHDLRFDTTIDVQSLTKSAVLAWLSGAKRRIGFGNPGGRELSKWFNNQRVDPKATHVVDRYLELLRPLGIESPAVRFQVPEHEADRAAAERMISRIGNRRRLCDHQSRSGLAVETLAGRSLRGRGASSWATPGICRRWSFGPARPSGQWPSKSPTPRTRPSTSLRRPRSRSWPPSARRAKVVHRFGHRSAASGRGSRHAVRRPLRPLAGRRVTAPMVRSTSRCSRCFSRVRPAPAAPPRRSTWRASRRRWFARRATRYCIAARVCQKGPQMNTDEHRGVAENQQIIDSSHPCPSCSS